MLANQKGRLWADIFAPKHVKQLVGNSVNIKRFKEWMMSWNSEKRKEIMRNHNPKKKKKPKVKDGKIIFQHFLFYSKLKKIFFTSFNTNFKITF